MSKYFPLWQHIAATDGMDIVLSYDEIQSILGFPIDHSFLTFKKELLEFCWEVAKISMNEKKVIFKKK